MAGNGDEAERGGPVAADWAEGIRTLLRGLVDDAVVAVVAARLDDGDVAGADRLARTVVNIARAVKAVESLETSPGTRADKAEALEDEMSEDREYKPERLAAMRDELFSRCIDRRALVERKTADGDAGRAGAVQPSVGLAEAVGPPVAPDHGLADLGDAGRPGRGQDLCGGLLAA